MRRRLYYLLPDVAQARAAMDELLLARIGDRHVHFIARDGTSLEGLREASALQKTDLVRGAQRGLLAGALLGVGAGVAFASLVGARPGWQVLTLVGATAIGAAFGAWASSMAGSALPSVRLARFQSLIQAGMVLMILDVPERRVEELKSKLGSGGPDAIDVGTEPNIPAFP